MKSDISQLQNKVKELTNTTTELTKTINELKKEKENDKKALKEELERFIYKLLKVNQVLWKARGKNWYKRKEFY